MNKKRASTKKKNRQEKQNRNITNNINNKNKNFRNLNNIEWNFECEDIFKCYVDTNQKINLYYIESFEPEDRQDFIYVLKECSKLFDENKYPKEVINYNNNGGFNSLNQLFMGILSPLLIYSKED